ncbi:MAG: hypothetical protein M1821_009989 [Bathelium mastoideum]|nr:MAG: hypothetical protein M1821_009989 [Bathelium mastoideum]KAI9690241.1 MAG: hypothetical protein M1822_009202 [Bathelium mastoideum]
MSIWLSVLFLGLSSASTQIPSVEWQKLNQTVGGRLFTATPLAKPCYNTYDGQPNTPDQAQCSAIGASYQNESFIASKFAGYTWTNWGSCQATGAGCSDFQTAANVSVLPSSDNCDQGSVSSYYVEALCKDDIQATLSFAKNNSIPLVVKGSGHDYKGRSSGPNSLALWTYNVKPPLVLNKGFVPDGCASAVGDGITFGGGQDFGAIYDFANANNVTVVGGASPTVRAAGGWLLGGGHGALSVSMGLGVDNALQIRAILPNGTDITANQCQNQDLFFALRGGGGNAFGVVYEVTTRTHPSTPLIVAGAQFVCSDSDCLREFIQICAESADQWATQGWGGYITIGSEPNLPLGFILMTPLINETVANASMANIMNFFARNGNNTKLAAVLTLPSFYSVYTTFIQPNEDVVGVGMAVGSRLLPRTLFQSAAGQQQVTDALLNVSGIVSYPSQYQPDARAPSYGGPLQILITPPAAYSLNGTAESSVTPTWRNSLWHIVARNGFAPDADAQTISNAFAGATAAAQVLRELAPQSGAYQNEADIFEPDPVDTFWGRDNYDRLLQIKTTIDPGNVLTCWNCIGWSSSDSRYDCYPKHS